ncbi:IS110 family transposase [Natroniella acetigena]|uniref:IS110 family transposase n=1 Tax=Natroniella acetigena TaxID=52004 RepID=UPI00200A305A|nr:IS110 family transposase [Natroniella acetigena]MCK8828587.1 IS110 family transposase [Natroniella acetigena]
MNYNRNRKIRQVKISTLVVGVDIAKKNHVARGQDYRGIEYGKALSFTNSDEGFDKFLKWMCELKDKHEKEDIIVGMEPTGHYWLNLAQFLKRNKTKVVLINPSHTKKSKELDDNSPTKNDKKDAKVIAQLVKDGRYSEPNILVGVYADIRVAMTHMERLNKDLQRVKGKVHQFIDKYFPEYLTVFKSWEGKASLVTLKEFPLPDEILKMTPEEIVLEWKKEVKRAVGIKRAKKLKKAAKRSVGLTEGTQIAKFELSYLLTQYEMIKYQIEQLMIKIKGLIKKVSGTKAMLSIKGVGIKTVAGFISEVGDINGYAHPRQIQKLAGLNLMENSSGQHKGRTCITKRGRAKLRALLYRVMLPLVAKNEEFKTLHEYYTTRPNNPLKKKQSLIALCCKLIRILFALWKKQVEYDGEKLMKDIKCSNLQGVA